MTQSLGPANPVLRRRVGRWLVACAVMLLLLVVIGGVTRLTESGLSITEWKPVAGVLPPFGEAAWQEEFAKYQRIPEYRAMNRGMDLSAFKRIYLVEYTHRLSARLVGLVIAIPLLVFLVQGALGSALARRLVMLLVLMGAQGALGWYMVQSGLSERTDVSQYRLAAHLSLALVLFGLTVWTAADLLIDHRSSIIDHRLRRWAAAYVGLVFLTGVAGAFVAGLDAGRAYNTFPLMGGRVLPRGYFQLEPWWRNLFEHVPAVQFNHRMLGILSALGPLGLCWATRRAEPGVRRWGAAVGVTALAQAGLGITTLLLFVPIPLAALHQAGAVVLLGFGLLLLHALTPVGTQEPSPAPTSGSLSPSPT
jgi:cytochrome c oxidase assembly protein subunit 15